METTIAWLLPFVVIALLQQALVKLDSSVGRAIATYVAFSLLFGCVHFLYYRHNPASYIVSKDVPVPAAAQAAVDMQKPLLANLHAISILDALLLNMAQPSQNPRAPLRFSVQSEHYRNQYPNIDIDSWIRMTVVGPRKDVPVYAAMIQITITDNYRGIEPGTTMTFRLGEFDSPEGGMEEVQLINSVVRLRKGFVEEIEQMFEPGTVTPALFSLWDFFYFSFSIVGVGEVIPGSTLVRMLVLLQVLCTLMIPIILERQYKREIQSTI